MPSKKKKYNARFPPARIKKIMQMDEEVGKVAATVPVIISRALELFIESLIMQASKTTLARNAKTLSTSHIKQAIESEPKYQFLRELVSSVPDHQTEDDGGNTNNSLAIHPTASGSSTSHGANSDINPTRRPRGRPRKARDAAGSMMKKEGRKRVKKESSEGSASEDSEGTDEAEGDSDQEPNGGTSSTTGPAAHTLSHSLSLADGGPAGSHPDLVTTMTFPGFPAHSVYPPGMPIYPGLPGRVVPSSVSWPPSSLQPPGTSYVAAAVTPGLTHPQEDDDYDT